MISKSQKHLVTSFCDDQFFFLSATKSSIVAAALFVLHKKTDLISAPASCVHLSVIIFFVYFKVGIRISQLFHKEVKVCRSTECRKA